MFLLVVFILVQNCCPVDSIKTLAVSHELVFNLSTESIYDRTAHPGDLLVAGQPVSVGVYIYVESMSTFRADTMDFRVDIYFQQQWRDIRLEHMNDTSPILIRDISVMDMLWRPNIYFANARHSQYHDITERNFLAWIYPNGTVIETGGTSALTLK